MRNCSDPFCETSVISTPDTHPDAEHYAAQKPSTMTEGIAGIKFQISQSEKATVLPISTSCVSTPIRAVDLFPYPQSSQSASGIKRTSNPYLMFAKNRAKERQTSKTEKAQA